MKRLLKVCASVLALAAGAAGAPMLAHADWLEDAAKPALEFFQLRDTTFLPALKSGEKQKAEAILNEKLRPLYERHLQAILQLDDKAYDFTAAREADASTVVGRANFIMPALLIIIITFVVFLKKNIKIWLHR